MDGLAWNPSCLAVLSIGFIDSQTIPYHAIPYHMFLAYKSVAAETPLVCKIQSKTRVEINQVLGCLGLLELLFGLTWAVSCTQCTIYILTSFLQRCMCLRNRYV